MENAVKALEIAAGILFAILIIGLASYAYDVMSQSKRMEYIVDRDAKAVSVNRDFESFNKELYGTELLSLCNLVEDFNTKISGNTDGYTEITGKVKLKVPFKAEGFSNQLNGTVNLLDVSSYLNEVNQKIENLGKSNITFSLYGVNYSFTLNDSLVFNPRVLEKLHDENITVYNKIDSYKKLRNSKIEFSSKSFKPVNIKYNSITGYIEEIQYEEI